jgi:hypothetical protein
MQKLSALENQTLRGGMSLAPSKLKKIKIVKPSAIRQEDNSE